MTAKGPTLVDSSPRVVKIFVSSPVDVAPERGRVQAVAAKLNRDYDGLVRFDTVLWEEHFYKADRSFQPQIQQPEACDVLVSIFWTRVGTELPADFARMPNGKPYPSGTAYELLSALEASKAKGVPDVYVFRKTADAVLPTADADRRRQAQMQLDALEAFWSEWFKSEQGHFKAAFQTFAATDEFERQIEQLLRQWLESHGLLGPRLKWPKEKGSPFPGLAAFEAEHAAVFFGRERAIDEARRRLAAAAERATPFLLIVGASGSGKSSLARAGLVPRLTTPGIVASVDVWRTAIMKPSEGQAGPVASLAAALFAALPELSQGDFSDPAALADNLRRGGAAAARPVIGALTRLAETARQERRADRPMRPALLLLVDQLEELFAQTVGDAERTAFAESLKELLATGRIWCVATLRADLYELLIKQPLLKGLKETGASLDLGPPGPAELAEIVRAPAAAAGLTFENNAEHGALDERLLGDAKTAESLPLLQFTLRQLYERRAEADGVVELKHAAYDALGGLQGAIAAEAERAVAGLPAGALNSLPRLLRQLAEPARDGKTLTLREVAQAEVTVEPAEASLVEALTGARILVARRDAAGRPTLRLAHDAVLTSWPRAQTAAQASREFYRVRAEVEDALRLWREHGQPRDRLIQPGVPLAEAERLVADFSRELPADVTAFVGASRQRARARQRLVAAAAVFFFALAVAATGAGLWALAERHRAVAERARAEATLAAATATANGLVFDLAQRFRNAVGVPAALVKDILDRARALQDELSKSGQVTPDLRHSQASALTEIAESLLAIGDTSGALSAAEQAQQIHADLLAAAPGDVDWQRALAVSYEKVGDVQVARGDLAAALKSYQDDRAIAERLAQSYPGSAILQRDLSVASDKIGNVLVAQGDIAGAFKAYRDGLAIAKRLAESNTADAAAQRDLSVSYIKVGDLQMAQGDLAHALQSYRDSLAIRAQLAKSDSGNAGGQRDLAVAHERIGDVQVAQGDLASALASYNDSLGILNRLTQSDPGNAGWQRDLSVSYERSGDIQVERGDLASAFKAYSACLSIRSRLAQSDPGNAGWQNDLAVAHVKVGEVQTAQGDLAGALQSFRDSLALLDRLANADPDNAQVQRHRSVSLNKIGDVQVAQGHLPDALVSYRGALAVSERLAKSDPANADWQRDLAVSEERVGTVELSQGDAAAALASYQASLAILERLAKADPANAQWQHSLAVSYQRIGNVQMAQGALPAALESYQADSAIMERLAKADPGNMGWQRDLSVADEKIGDVEVAQRNLPAALDSYKASLSIRERLAKSDPGNAGWQRDLSIAYNRIGDILGLQRDLAGALESYLASLAIIERMAESDPGNAGWQRDYAITLNRIGDIHIARGDPAAALESYRKGLVVIERAVNIDPGNATWQRDLAISYAKIATALRKTGDADEALAALRRGQAVIERMGKISANSTTWKADLAWFAGQIAELTSAKP